MAERALVERIWFGGGALPALARGALAPLSALYRGVVGARNRLYDRHVLAARAAEIPAVSVGNLSVGGTGKTPVSAWVAGELARRGGHPAVVLRGYGGDEPLVHATLNPELPVVVAPDRLAGLERARVLGADVAVLDDAFQHRRAARAADLVLVSADGWTGRVRLLPAGPWREPLTSLRRATLAVVTRKAASPAAAARVVDVLRRAAPEVPVAVVHLAPDELRAAVGPERRPLADIRGARVHAISAIGDPAAFVRQLEAEGARVTASLFPDHHGYTAEEAAELAAVAARAELVVCTLKDAVKLAPLWPRAGVPLWYVSQRVVPEEGSARLGALLDDVLAVRSRTSNPMPPAPTGVDPTPHGH